MQLDKKEMSHVGAVRGRNVYELTSRRQLVTGASNSLDNVLVQRFINPTSLYRKRVHGAELNMTATGDYELSIPASGTSPAVHVPIHFEAKPLAPMTGGIHGVEQGPAQYKLTRDASGWQAKIEIDESLHRRDVLFTIGHELDEIALIVRANPSDNAAILAEGRASLFKPGTLVTAVTAHDRAAARELCAQWQDLQQPPRGTTPTGIKKRSDRLARMIDAMGLSESTNLFDKFHLLRKEGAPDELLRRIGAPEELKRYRNSAQFRALRASLPTLSSIIDGKLISHLMIPSDPGRRLFSQAGIKGGHHDKLLHDFVHNHPQIVIVKEAEKVVGGAVYCKYSQYRWKGSGPKPTPSDSRFPKQGDALAGTYYSDWVVAKQRGVPHPKTTFSNLQNFLLAVDEAWHRWYLVHGHRASGKTILFTQTAKFAALDITGYLHHIPPHQFRLQTVFVEASWF